MTVYTDATAVRDQAIAAGTKAAKRKSRRLWIIGAPIGVLAVGGAAFAAVALFGFGSIDAQAATLKNLGTSNAKLTGTLVPGQSVGGSVDVTNDNDFPVTVTAVILQDSSLHGQGAGCVETTLTPGGTPVGTYPGSGGGTGHQFTLASSVAIPANSAKTVTVPGVVSQASTATALCGVKASFAVVSAVGN